MCYTSCPLSGISHQDMHKWPSLHQSITFPWVNCLQPLLPEVSSLWAIEMSCTWWVTPWWHTVSDNRGFSLVNISLLQLPAVLWRGNTFFGTLFFRDPLGAGFNWNTPWRKHNGCFSSIPHCHIFLSSNQQEWRRSIFWVITYQCERRGSVWTSSFPTIPLQ